MTLPAFQALSGVANACQILPNVITGGQPNALQLRALKEAGGAVVLDVRDPMESRPVDEAALVQQLGMEYVNMPVRAGSLDDATLDRILAVLRGAGERTVFFHCGSGNRVGGALIPYFMLDQGRRRMRWTRPCASAFAAPRSWSGGSATPDETRSRKSRSLVTVVLPIRPLSPRVENHTLPRLPPLGASMPRLIRPLAAGLFSAALTASLTAQSQIKPIDPANLDTTCSPCKDFFQYANGGWLKRSEIPGDQPRWGSFNELQEQNYAALKDVLTEAATNASSTKDANIRKLGTFYGTCMDSTAVERAGMGPLRGELKRIAAIRDRRGVEAAIVRLHRLGIPAGFVFRSNPDAKKSARTIAEVYQGGLGLPDRDYYTKTDSASERIRSQYIAHVANMLRLSGQDKAAAEGAAQAIMRLETALASASMTREAQRDPEAIYHLTTRAALQKETPSFAWTSYMDGLGLKSVDEVNVAQPEFISAFDSLLTAAPLEEWKAYLRWTSSPTQRRR